MYITHTGLPGNEPLVAQAETPGAINGTSDINFFNAQMSSTRQPVSGVSTSMAANLFSIGGPESTATSKRVQRGIRDTLSNKQTKEAHALPEALAAANLGVVAQVKVVGLLVKGIDKIATMG